MKTYLRICLVVLLSGGLWAMFAYGIPSRSEGQIRPEEDRIADTAGERPVAGIAAPTPGDRRVQVQESNPFFRLEIRGPDGHSLQGWAYWSLLETRPWIGTPMVPAKGFALPKEGSGQMSFDGSIEIPAPLGAALWLRIQWGEGDRTREAYRLLGAMERKEVLRLDEGPGALHVFLLDAALQKNLPHAEVRIFYTPADRSQPRRLLTTARSDGRGYVRFAKLPLGNYEILGPGAQLNDIAPHRASMALGGPAHDLAWPILLVEKAGVSEVALVVDSSLALVDDVPPKLYARRVGPGAPRHIAMPGSLRKGTQRFSMALSDGEYEMRVLPEGAAIVGGGYCLVTVKDGKAEPQRFSVQARTSRTNVEFLGLGRNDFPFRAWFRPEGRELDERETLFFTGPFKWRLPALDVNLPEGESRWVLAGRYGHWIARSTMYASSGPMRVALKRACKLEIRWFGPRALRASDTRLMIQTSQGEEIRSTSNQVVDVHRRSVVARVGAAVIPYGWAQVRCVENESGKLLWTRRVQVEQAWMTLDITD